MNQPRRKLSDVHAPWLFPLLFVLATAVCAWLLYLTGYKTFYYDEWDFIVKGRAWTLDVFLLPHNEHWSTIPIFVWKVLFVAFGIRSHIPFEAALLITHGLVVILLYALIRRHSGDLPAFAGAMILLVLAGGGTNMVWAFQIGFVGSCAFGLASLLLIDGSPMNWSRIALASVCLLFSLMCSSVGLAFLATATVWLLLDSRLRRYWPGIAAPIAIFGVWFLLYGAGLAGTPGAPCPTCAPTGVRADIHRGPIGVGYLLNLGLFVLSGLQASVGAIFAAPDAATLFVALCGVLLALHLYLQRGVQTWQVAFLIGGIGWFTLVGLGRATRGPGGAADSHYLYIGAVFLLPLLADTAKRIPWRGVWRPLAMIGFALVLIANLTELRDVALGQTGLMKSEVAELQTTQAFRGAPDMKVDQSLDDTIMPQLKAVDLFAASDDLGSPVPIPTLKGIAGLPPAAVDQEMLSLFGGRLKFTADPSRPLQGTPCQTVDSSAGSNIDFQMPSGGSLMLQSAKTGDAFIFLSYMSQFPTLPLKEVGLSAMTPTWVDLPNAGKTIVWHLRIQTLALGSVLVCSPASPQVSRPTTFHADAANFTFGPGWASIHDGAAGSGMAARASAGTPGPQGAFGSGFIPTPGSYDIWVRLRVTGAAGRNGEMQVGLADLKRNAFASSATFRPVDAGTEYSWLIVDSNVALNSGDPVRFQTNIARRLSTDWYLDQILLVATGSAVPRS